MFAKKALVPYSPDKLRANPRASIEFYPVYDIVPSRNVSRSRYIRLGTSLGVGPFLLPFIFGDAVNKVLAFLPLFLLAALLTFFALLAAIAHRALHTSV